MARRYEKQVHEFIRANYKGRGSAELAELTNEACGTDFTPSRMKVYLTNHKLRTGAPRGNKEGSRLFPKEVQEFFREHNQGTGTKEMAELLNARFGTSYTAEQIKAYRNRYKMSSGLTGRFEPGHVPANKGKKVTPHPNAVATQFKNGHTPHNHLPVGSEVVNTDGYLVRKVAEPNKWAHVHRLNWEAAHGPIPENHVIIFKDKNKLNVSPDNLLLVSRGELAVMNRRGLVTENPEATEVGQTIAKLIRATTEKKKKKRGKHETD